jgi:hypothetical protein
MSSIPRLALIAMSIAVAPAAWSASQKMNSQAQQQYQQDRAFCNSPQATQDRATCLKEASRAYQEARRGTLEPGSGGSASQDSMEQRTMGAAGDQTSKKRAATKKTKVKAKAKTEAKSDASTSDAK